MFGLRKPGRVKHNGQKLSEILDAHAKFVRREPGGVRADLAGADLSRCNLQGVNLTDALLQEATLDGSDLRQSKLTRANFTGAKMRRWENSANDMPLTRSTMMAARLKPVLL